ncbi:MAG: molybdopterin molybdotransferase MoeA [Eggerthellaceae bacterium]|jgi:molybdopterin molybdotransferase
MRDHSHHIQMTRDQAVAAILGACDFHPSKETIPISKSYGRVLAADAVAQLDMPNCLTCAMDSVAVHWSDFEHGMPDTSDWERGVQWQFANTGVGMPEGFDTAIVVEHVTFSEDAAKVSFDALPSKKYAGTIPAGERMHAGDVLAPAGTRIDPLVAAIIASGNNADVQVWKKPRVGFLPTGNELVPVGRDVPRGKNIDSNSLLMQGKIEKWGGEAVRYPIVPDTPDKIRAAIRQAVDECDIVVLNAGSSKGSDDWNLEVVEQMGQVLCHQTNHGPGHHSSFSIVDGTPIVGISGPPGGAAITVDFYLRPVMNAFLGLPTEPETVTARLMAPFPVGHGPSHKGTAVVQPEHLPGEKRPKEEGPFFSIRQMRLESQPDGVMGAYPLAGSHPKPIEAAGADAYYLLDTTLGVPAPEPGTLIQVELRG